MNIYLDFLSREEIEFLTGRKQKNFIKIQLQIMGIPFKENANGFPIVRRDYAQSKTVRKVQIPNEETEWIPNVLCKV